MLPAPPAAAPPLESFEVVQTPCRAGADLKRSTSRSWPTALVLVQ